MINGAGGGTCVSTFSKMQRPEICRCACVKFDTINQHGNCREYNPLLVTREPAMQRNMGCPFSIYSLYMHIHNSFMNIHNSFMDIQKSFMDIHNSINDSQKSNMDIHNSFMDIHK